MRRTVLVLMAVPIVAGCAVRNPAGSVVTGLGGQDAPSIADAMAEYIRGTLPAASSTVNVLPASGDDSAGLDELLVADLRHDGFAVSEPGQSVASAHVVKFVVGPLNNGVMVRLSIDRAEAACLFGRDSTGGLRQASPLTVQDAGTATIRPPASPPPPNRFLAAAAPPPAQANGQVTLTKTATPAQPTDWGHHGLTATMDQLRTKIRRGTAAANRAGRPTPIQEAATAPVEAPTGAAAPALPAPVQAQPLPAPAGASVSGKPQPLAVPIAPMVAAGSSVALGGAKLAPVPASPPSAPEPRWTLQAGRPVGEALKDWGRQSGWTVFWLPPVDWPAPTTTEFVGSFRKVAEAIVIALHEGGADIRGRAYLGNRTLVITAPGASASGPNP